MLQVELKSFNCESCKKKTNTRTFWKLKSTGEFRTYCRFCGRVVCEHRIKCKVCGKLFIQKYRMTCCDQECSKKYYKRNYKQEWENAKKRKNV